MAGDPRYLRVPLELWTGFWVVPEDAETGMISYTMSATDRFGRKASFRPFPDIGSQVRLGADSENLATYYDALLAGESFAEAHAPEAVVHVGGRALSKRLEQFLSRSRPDPYVVVHLATKLAQVRTAVATASAASAGRTNSKVCMGSLLLLAKCSCELVG